MQQPLGISVVNPEEMLPKLARFALSHRLAYRVGRSEFGQDIGDLSSPFLGKPIAAQSYGRIQLFFRFRIENN